MKKLIQLIIFLFLSLNIFCQEEKASLTESNMGLQIGTFGVWAYNEAKLSNTLTLRSDLGLDVYFKHSGNKIKSGYLIPALSLEPRFYYNLKRRLRKSKRIDSNSGDFLGLKIKLNTKVFLIPSDAEALDMITITPLWGIKRAIGRNFNFEFCAGGGYRYNFDANYKDYSEFIIYLNLRIGVIL
ncbi:MAG: hypothetical protein C0598_05475 [Marinilabiliales bacterium]|nr:MAG: hypothetical protein C0598_05475 [Marinilabiliales bacterium]